MIEFLEIFLFGQGNVQQAMPIPIGIAIGGMALNVIGGIFGAGKAKKAERAARRERAQLQRKLNYLENNRQAIINPAEGVSNLSGLAQDLSGQLTNPMANLSVATQAAEMEIEQADISLANTLDTIRATGAGAGGATALAQAALQSKKGVSASIEKQEANNEQLRAQGEQQLDRMRMQEAARVQGIQIGEGGRVQGLDAAGKQFMFNAQEGREMQQLDRVSAQLAGAQAQAMQASAARQANTAGLIGGLASIGGNLLTGLASQNQTTGVKNNNLTFGQYQQGQQMANSASNYAMQVAMNPMGINLPPIVNPSGN